MFYVQYVSDHFYELKRILFDLLIDGKSWYWESLTDIHFILLVNRSQFDFVEHTQSRDHLNQTGCLDFT